MWRKVVRDGAREGGGETGPNPQPLSHRLSGLRPDTSEGSEAFEDVGKLSTDIPSSADSGDKKQQEGETRASDLRLDEPEDTPKGPGEDNSSPTRGPPKTPKRTKASSPQPSDVSAEERCCCRSMSSFRRKGFLAYRGSTNQRCICRFCCVGSLVTTYVPNARVNVNSERATRSWAA